MKNFPPNPTHNKQSNKKTLKNGKPGDAGWSRVSHSFGGKGSWVVSRSEGVGDGNGSSGKYFLFGSILAAQNKTPLSEGAKKNPPSQMAVEMAQIADQQWESGSLLDIVETFERTNTVNKKKAESW